MDLPIALADALLRGALIALAVLMGVRLARDVSGRAVARVGPVLMAGLVVQTACSLPWLEAQPPRAWMAPLIGLSVGNSVLFWLFARALFDDEVRLQPRHYVIWAAVVGLGTLFYGVVVLPRCHGGGLFAHLLTLAMRWTPLVFAALVLQAVVRNWREDLVEARRRLRLFLLVAGILYTVFTALARLSSPDGRLSATMASLDTGLLLCIMASMALRVLRLQAAGFFPPTATPPLPEQGRDARGASVDPADERLAQALRLLMEGQQLYRSEGLTVAALASRLGTPEYRLRRHINQRLGHRNFNAYINGFRLQHARRALADRDHAEVPVLTIALDAGFQSIGPFNRAFKAATGLTPSEYRREHLADS